MTKLIFTFILFIAVGFISAQQISVARIDKMANMPSPYSMRNWKKVAIDYDNFVFDNSKTGTYLPITKISNSNGVNYSEINDIFMDTYVGQSGHGNVAECINILPAIVGASLVGVDKTKHLNINWVTKVKDFFNLKNGQNVYLNNYSNSTGNDWWYEIMPNIFFYQLYSLYPNADKDFESQFTTIADRELDVLYKLGGNTYPWSYPSLNYRAFNLISGLPNTSSVPEPETAGSIAWIMYQAYCQTKQAKYLQGTELALDFLQNWTSNPSYEIQLPYGIVTAARMNAIEGTNYNIDKFMNWTFSAGQNTLRAWGSIVGNWNGYDVSGLIGEANDANNDYAFVMNGFQHAAALAPVAKYDKRYAKAIGKWILNLANASRLFYWNALPQANQESASYNWAKQYDLNACIPYESMKQNWNGTKPCAMGDAVTGGWASTNLSLYSGSSVGYLASIIDTTNVKGVLKIDLNKTDFRGENIFPNYLFYNPNKTSKNVEITVPSGNYDIYDAISETVLATNVSGLSSFNIDSNSVKLLVIYPTGKSITKIGRIRKVDGTSIDYHCNYDYSTSLRIKCFVAKDSIIQLKDSTKIYCLVENNTSSLGYKWYINDSLIATTTSNEKSFANFTKAGVFTIKCKAFQNNDTIESKELKIKVVEILSIAPKINAINFSQEMPFDINSNVNPIVSTNTSNIEYKWKCDAGSLTDNTSKTPIWSLPSSKGIFSLKLIVSNEFGADSLTKTVLVKDLSNSTNSNLVIYYPFDGDTKNYAQNSLDATSVNAILATGANKQSNSAYQLSSSATYIYTTNQNSLNFTDKVAISFWIKPDYLPSYEQFIVSHGSWEERYKVSITPEKKLRWTLKTNSSVVDVDDDTVMTTSKFTHYCLQYTSFSMELYRNGKLISFKPLTGSILSTSKNLTISRKDQSETNYNFRGIIDEVRIYNSDLNPSFIKTLPTIWYANTSINEQSSTSSSLKVFPNPFSEEITIKTPSNIEVSEVKVYNLLGKCVYKSLGSNKNLKLSIPDGVYFMKTTTETGAVFTTKIIKQK